MSAFTRLGSSIWDWEPWTDLTSPARILWLALYTSSEAKRHIPGLWQGGVPAMADAARMQPDDVRDALDTMLVREMVEYDPKFRVLRLCELPDAGEYPSNGRVIKGWWTKFQTVPACPVRDAHVRTIGWILDTGSQRAGASVSPDHKEAWERTFGTIVVPTPRRRGLRRLADSDTSTRAQPSLFPCPQASPVPSDAVGTITDAGGYPQNQSQAVDNSASLRQLNKIRAPETVSDTVSDTVSHTNRIPDPGSRILDLSGEERGEGRGERGNEVRPSLSLVPPFTAIQVLAELAAGLWDPAHDRAYQDALGAMIPRWVSLECGLDDFRVLGQYNAHIGRRWNARLLVGCDIQAEISTARRVLDWRDTRMNMLREAP